MPSEFPRSPKLLKGALAVYEAQTPGTQPKLIVFQYNPEQLRRTLAARTPPRDPNARSAAPEDVLRVQGAPVETINMTVVLDAADQLEDPLRNRATSEHGLGPVLATLELLLYPLPQQARQTQNQARQGAAQVSHADVPLTLLVWGKDRVVPVLLTNFTVTEEGFDPVLNPIQAKVELGMRVLTDLELRQSTLGYDAFLAYQRQKRTLAGQVQNRGDESQIRGLLPL